MKICIMFPAGATSYMSYIWKQQSVYYTRNSTNNPKGTQWIAQKEAD